MTRPPAEPGGRVVAGDAPSFAVAAAGQQQAGNELRARQRRAEDDARAARFLAGGADRDTAELRAEVREFRAEMRGFRDQNNRVLSSMREDLTDLRHTSTTASPGSPSSSREWIGTS